MTCICGRWPACLHDTEYPCIPHDEDLSDEQIVACLGFKTVDEYRDWNEKRILAAQQPAESRPIATLPPIERSMNRKICGDGVH